MKKILWLTSWYPNRTDRFTGDFIQRHARAVSQYQDITVLHVVPNPNPSSEELIENKQIKEWLVYYKGSSPFRYLKYYKRLIKSYISKEGLPDLVHVHIPIKAGLLGLWMKKKYKIPFLLTDHYGIYNELVDEPYSKRSPFFKFFTRKILRESSLFLPVSDDMGRAVSRLVLPKNYRVIFNTVNESYFHYRPRVRDNFRFIHVSNMAPLKNLPAILRAFAAISKLKPETELVIVGPHGPEELAAAVPTGLLNKSIFFKGEIPYHEVALEMQSADGLLLFSRTENMPCVVLEALCCGLPVIAPAVGGIPEVIDPSNGILVRPGYEEELKQAMLGMITESARFDGSSISKKAIARFGYPAIGEQISQIYEELISGRSD